MWVSPKRLLRPAWPPLPPKKAQYSWKRRGQSSAICIYIRHYRKIKPNVEWSLFKRSLWLILIQQCLTGRLNKFLRPDKIFKDFHFENWEIFLQQQQSTIKSIVLNLWIEWRVCMYSFFNVDHYFSSGLERPKSKIY